MPYLPSRIPRRTLLRAGVAGLTAAMAARVLPVHLPRVAAQAVDFGPLAEVVQAAMERARVPGAAVGIIAGSQTYRETFGVTNVDQPAAVTPETLFQIGSISKTYTATALLRLVDAGLVDLETPIRRWLPELELADEDAAARLTLRHIFTHTGGWYGDIGMEDDRFGDDDDAIARFMPELARAPSLAPVGEVYSYNNAAFVLAGRLLETLTGMPYRQAVATLIFEPLGMTQTYASAAEAQQQPHVDGHTVRDGQAAVAPTPARPHPFAPAGGLISTADDQLRYLRFQMSGDPPLLRPETLAMMQSPQFHVGPPGPEEATIGLAWLVGGNALGTRLIEHGGETIGQVSLALAAPERQTAVIVLTNGEAGGTVTAAVSRWVIANVLGVPPPAGGPVPALRLTPDQLAAYAGRFAIPGVRVLALRVEGAQLLVSALSGVPVAAAETAALLFYSPDRAVVRGGPFNGVRLDFIRNRQGQVTWVRYNGRVMVRQG